MILTYLRSSRRQRSSHLCSKKTTPLFTRVYRHPSSQNETFFVKMGKNLREELWKLISMNKDSLLSHKRSFFRNTSDSSLFKKWTYDIEFVKETCCFCDLSRLLLYYFGHDVSRPSKAVGLYVISLNDFKEPSDPIKMFLPSLTHVPSDQKWLLLTNGINITPVIYHQWLTRLRCLWEGCKRVSSFVWSESWSRTVDYRHM